MENSDTIEETEASNVVGAASETQNDSASNAALAETMPPVSSTKGEDISEDEDFGDFAVASHSEEADPEGGNLVMSENARSEGNVVSSALESDVAESNDLGTFKRFATANDASTMKVDNLEQEETYDDPFAHLSSGHDAAVDELGASNSETATAPETDFIETFNEIKSDIEQSASNDDNGEFFSTHDVNLVDSESGMESDNGQDGSPKSDAGYFSTVTDVDNNEEGTKDESGDEEAVGNAASVKSSDESEEYVPEEPLSLATGTGDDSESNAIEGPPEGADDGMSGSPEKSVHSEISAELDVAAVVAETDRTVDNEDEDAEGTTVVGTAGDVLEHENEVALLEETDSFRKGALVSDEDAVGDDDGFGTLDAAPPEILNDKGAEGNDVENDQIDTSDEQPLEQPKSSSDLFEDAEVDEKTMDLSAIDSNAATDENDFGDFGGSFEEVATSNIEDGQPVERPKSSSDLEEEAEVNEETVDQGAIDSNAAMDDNDFGGFGSFEEVATSNIEGLDGSVPAEDELAQQKEEHTGTSINDESTPEPNESIVVTDEAEDDDFGDFNAFEQTDSATNEVVEERTLQEEPADDDFGDFGAFEQADETPASKEEPANVEQPDDDDDFGDFGDFTDFSEAPNKDDNDAVVDAATESSISGSSPPLSGPPTSSVIDPVIEKADAVFQEVFRRDNGSVNETEDEQERVVVAVKSTLTDLVTINVNEGPSEWYTTALESVMRGVEHLDKTGPIAVVNDCSEYPYAHFTVPVCGLPVTDVDIQGRSMRRHTSKKALHECSQAVGPSFSLDSADSVEPPAPAQQTTGTVVDLPPLKSGGDSIKHEGSRQDDSDFAFADFPSSSKNDTTKSSNDVHVSDSTSNGNKETISSSAKQFLRQIPDLSFMLKPKLSLPKKS